MSALRRSPRRVRPGAAQEAGVGEEPVPVVVESDGPPVVPVGTAGVVLVPVGVLVVPAGVVVVPAGVVVVPLGVVVVVPVGVLGVPVVVVPAGVVVPVSGTLGVVVVPPGVPGCRWSSCRPASSSRSLWGTSSCPSSCRSGWLWL